MKFGPKETKELNEYLRTGRNRKREFLGGGITFASDLTQPEPKREVVEIDLFNQFNLRNPKADGGRIKLNVGTPSKKELEIAQKVYGIKPEFEGKTGLDLWKEIGAKKRSKIREGTVTGEPVGMGKLKKNQLGKDDFIKLANQNKGKTFKEFAEILKGYKTRDGKDFTTQNISERLSNYNLKNFFKRDPAMGVSDAAKQKAFVTRQKNLAMTAPVKAGGTTKFPFHHIRQIGGEVPLTTDDLAIIDQRVNSVIGGKYNKALNRTANAITKNLRLALEAMNEKKENVALKLMEKVDELNDSAEKTVNKAIQELPDKFKKYVGFNKFTLPTNEYGFPISNEPLIIKKVGGMPVTKSAVPLTDLTLNQEKILKKTIRKQAEAGKVGPVKLLKNFIDFAPLPGPLKPIKKLFAGGGRIGFMAGTIPGGYGKQANRYLKEIESDMHKGYQYYKRSGGKKSFKDYMRESMSRYFADGGIAGLSGGDRSGPPPERGPNPQGLLSLMKRGMKI